MRHTMYHLCNSQRATSRLTALLLLPFGAALVACSAEELPLGGQEVVPEIPVQLACDGGVVNRDITIHDQQGIDALAGCTTVEGELRIDAFLGMDLSPLASLRQVGGALDIRSGEFEVASLHGLESLEQVGMLAISGLTGDLTPLRNLRSVHSADTNGARIELVDCDGLTDLRGLENVSNWQDLTLDGLDQLESLDGLSVRRYEHRLFGLDLPQLRDLSALAATPDIDGIYLWNTGIENFDGINFWTLGYLNLEDNAALTSLDGLDSLSSVGELVINNNDSLRQLPELPHLQGISSIMIINNAALERVPAYRMPVFEQPGVEYGKDVARHSVDSSPNRPKAIPDGFDLFTVGNNAQLRSIAAPPTFSSGNYVAIYDNPSLTDLDVGGVVDVDLFYVRNNPALANLDTRALQLAKRLEVVGNPLVPLSMFDSVLASQRELSETMTAE
jgi:hypothetical protein